MHLTAAERDGLAYFYKDFRRDPDRGWLRWDIPNDRVIESLAERGLITRCKVRPEHKELAAECYRERKAAKEAVLKRKALGWA